MNDNDLPDEDLDQVTVPLPIEINLDDLAFALRDVDTADLLRFIAYLDQLVADWDFTRDLADYFDNEMIIAPGSD